MATGKCLKFFFATMLLSSFCLTGFSADKAPKVAFEPGEGKIAITVGGEPLATYVYLDDEIWRPYFAHVRAPGGVQVTRNHPPQAGDLDDHALLHPGLFMGFRDISGNEYWHASAKVVGGDFVEKPKGGAGKGTFSVLNRYLSTDANQTVCEETCHYTFLARPSGVLLIIDSSFAPGGKEFTFGDSEEMGLGVRLATPIAVKTGKGGRITDSEGRVNGDEVWGKNADWCDYSGTIDGRYVGMTLMPDPENFRPCWWHARDYGFLVGNPFGRNAFTGGEKSKIVVKRGQPLKLRFGVMIHGSANAKQYNPKVAYADFLMQIGEK